MSIEDFSKNDNINLLWSVLVEELEYKFDNKTLQIIHRSFINNMDLFYDFEKSRTKTLLELNKKYIISFLEYTKNLEEQGKIFQNQKQEQEQEKAVTNEQYLQEKRSTFNRDYEQKQKEFDSLINKPIPSKPSFSDNIKDDKIKDIDSVLREMTNKRNYDININQQKDTNKWLYSNNTSIKDEKEINKKIAERDKEKILKPIETRQIKIHDEVIDNSIIENGIIDLDKQYSKSSPKNEIIKQVSWGINTIDNIPDREDHSIYTTEDLNIFKKFKTIQPKEQDSFSNLQQQVDQLNEKVNQILEILHSKVV
jgi:hypothetical protein